MGRCACFTFGNLAALLTIIICTIATARPMNHPNEGNQHPAEQDWHPPYIFESQPDVDTDLHMGPAKGAGRTQEEYSVPTMQDRSRSPNQQQSQYQDWHTEVHDGSHLSDAGEFSEEQAQERNPNPEAAGQDFVWIYNEAAGSPFRQYFGFARNTYGWKTLTPTELRAMILSMSPQWLQLQRAYEARRKEHGLRTQARTRLRKDENDRLGLKIIEDLGVDKGEFMQEVRSMHNRLPMNPKKRRYVIFLIRRLESEIKEYEATGHVKPGFNLSTLRPSYRHEGDGDKPEEEAGNAAGNRMIKLLHEIRVSLQSQAAEHDLEQKNVLRHNIDELNEWREQNDSKLRRIYMPFTDEEERRKSQEGASTGARAGALPQQRQPSTSSATELPRRRRGKERAESSQHKTFDDKAHSAYPSEAQQVRHALQLSRHISDAGLYQMEQHFLQPWSHSSGPSGSHNVPEVTEKRPALVPSQTETQAQPWRGSRQALMASLFGHEDEADDEGD